MAERNRVRSRHSTEPDKKAVPVGSGLRLKIAGFMDGRMQNPQGFLVLGRKLRTIASSREALGRW